GLTQGRRERVRRGKTFLPPWAESGRRPTSPIDSECPIIETGAGVHFSESDGVTVEGLSLLLCLANGGQLRGLAGRCSRAGGRGSRCEQRTGWLDENRGNGGG